MGHICRCVPKHTILLWFRKTPNEAFIVLLRWPAVLIWRSLGISQVVRLSQNSNWEASDILENISYHREKKSFVKSWQENKNFTLHSLFLCCLLSSCPCMQWTNCRTIILLSRSLYISSLLIVSHVRFLSSWLNNKTDRHFCFHENFTSAESTYSSLHLDGSSMTVQRNLSLLQYLAPEPWVGGSRMRLEEKGSWHRPAGSSSRCLWCHLHCTGLAFPWHSDRLPSRASFTTTVQEPPTNKYSQDPPERSGTRVTGCPGTAI